MNNQDLIKKALFLKKNPSLANVLPNSDIIALVSDLLVAFNTLQSAINTDKIKGKDGLTPKAGIDYPSFEQVDSLLTDHIRAFQIEHKTLLNKTEKRLAELRDGNDAEITPKQMEEVASLVYEMISLPDLDELIATNLTINNKATRDGLELLPDGEKLEMSAVQNLLETIEKLKDSIARVAQTNGGTIGKQQVYGFIRQAIADGTISSGAGGGHTIEDEGTPLTQRTNLNFVGAGVTVTDDAGNDATVVTIDGGGGTVNAYAETPTGLVNSSNTSYTLANTPADTDGVLVLLDGVTQYNGIDYTVSGTTITFTTAPATGSSIFAYYNTFTGGGGGGASAFTDLTDVPSSYTSQALKVVRVNAGATGLEFATVAGTGDVVGPASSTDNAIARFDATTGKLIQNSVAVIDDSGRFVTTVNESAGAERGAISARGITNTNLRVNLGYDETNDYGWLQSVNFGITRKILRIFTTALTPGADDQAALGSGTLSWSDLFLASGAIINWANGNATLTHSTGLLTSNVDVVVPDEAYDATAWDGSLEVPTKNAIRDKIDIMDTAITLNTAKVTNATHTGEVTGSGALTVDKTAITNKTLVTAAVGDHILVADASDSDNLKKVTVQTIVDLAGGGGGNTFNDIYIDQSGGTSDTYGVLAGTINGSNAVFTVSQAVYATGTLKVWLNGQLLTQGTGEDWTETTPASGTFTFIVAPVTGSLITVEYQLVVTNSSTIGDVIGPASSTDEAVARFDSTTGKLLQNSSVKITDNGSIVVPVNNTPSAPASGEMKYFSRAVANRLMPAFMGPSGLDSTVQPFMARNKVGYWNPPGNATTVPGVFGFTAPTVTNFTGTARNVATTNLFTRMRRLGYVTAATAGTVGNWRVAVYQYTVGDSTTGLGGFHYIKRFGISDAATVSGARMFTGMKNSTIPSNVEPNTLTNCIGIGHGAADTNMKLFYGGSAAQTPIDLGANFPSNTLSTDVYELALFSAQNSGDVSYEVTRLNTGDVATGTITNSGSTVLPTNTTLLAPWGYRTNNATALAVGLDVMSAYIETDY